MAIPGKERTRRCRERQRLRRAAEEAAALASVVPIPPPRRRSRRPVTAAELAARGCQAVLAALGELEALSAGAGFTLAQRAAILRALAGAARGFAESAAGKKAAEQREAERVVAKGKFAMPPAPPLVLAAYRKMVRTQPSTAISFCDLPKSIPLSRYCGPMASRSRPCTIICWMKSHG
jgi:hypothetical protein